MDAKRKINVLVATGLYPPETGGPATFVKMLEDNLDASQFALTVVPFAVVRKHPKLFRHGVFLFKLLSSGRKCDVIFALDGVSVGLPAALVSKIKKVPLVVRLGGDYAWEQGKLRFGVIESLDDFYTAKSLPLFVRLLTKIQTWVVNSASRVIVPSMYLKTIVSKWCKNPENITVVYSVPSLPTFVETQTNATKKQIIWSIARLVPWKGFIVLIEVVDELRQTYPGILLKIIGDGPDEPTLKELIKERNLQNNVLLTGRLSHQELIEESDEANMFVLNTAYEGFSHVILEMMRLKVPVITTNVGGNPELITHDDTGILITYNDKEALKTAITTLLEDNQKAQALSDSAYQRSLQFTKENSLKAIEDIITNVVTK